MNKSKYLALGLAGVIAFSPVAANAVDAADVPADEKEVISEIEEVSSYIEYEGKITEITMQEGGDQANASILVEGLEDDLQEKIIFHLSDDMPLISHETMEDFKVENLEEGMEVSAFFKENTPMTLSIPPQLNPGAVVIHDNEEDGFVEVAHFNEELVDMDNKLKLNISDDTILEDTEGNNLEAEDLEDESLMVFYTISTKSIPAKTTPEKVIVLGEEDMDLEDDIISVMDKVVVDEKELKLEHEIYNSDGRQMIPLRPISEALGYEVKWNNEERSVELTKGAQWTKVTIGEDNYNFAKMLVKLGRAPEIKENKTYVPVEFIEEVLKLDIDIDEGILEIE